MWETREGLPTATLRVGSSDRRWQNIFHQFHCFWCHFQPIHLQSVLSDMPRRTIAFGRQRMPWWSNFYPCCWHRLLWTWPRCYSANEVTHTQCPWTLGITMGNLLTLNGRGYMMLSWCYMLLFVSRVSANWDQIYGIIATCFKYISVLCDETDVVEPGPKNCFTWQAAIQNNNVHIVVGV